MFFARGLLLLIIAIPLVELYVLIEAGSYIGALPTVLLTVFTAFLGIWLVRVQGLSTMTRLQMNLAQGQMPAVEMVEGGFLAAAGVMLLIPGFVTDALGFLFLIPPIRQALARAWLARSGMPPQGPGGPGPGQGPMGPGSGDVIEGEFRREDSERLDSDRQP